MKPHKPFTVLVADEATHAAGAAFDEAARIAARIPLAGLHVVYLTPRGTPLDELEQLAKSLRADTAGRAAALGVGDRLLAVHVRAGDPVVAVATLARELVIDLVMTTTPARRGLFGRDAVARVRTELACPLVTVAPVEAVPEIEMLCNACAMTRARTKGKKLWCARHVIRHIHAHGWSYQTELPFSEHDSEFIPTGVAFQ